MEPREMGRSGEAATELRDMGRSGEAATEPREMGRSGEAGSAAEAEAKPDAEPELRSGRVGDMDSGRRMLPDCGLCFHERVPERPNAAALLATGFLGSMSSIVVMVSSLCGASCGGGEDVRSSAAAAVGSRGGAMEGVGVLAAFSCTSRGVGAREERGDCGVYGLSGEMERALSVVGRLELVGCIQYLNAKDGRDRLQALWFSSLTSNHYLLCTHCLPLTVPCIQHVMEDR